MDITRNKKKKINNFSPSLYVENYWPKREKKIAYVSMEKPLKILYLQY
jgi:hypothetical protein